MAVVLSVRIGLSITSDIGGAKRPKAMGSAAERRTAIGENSICHKSEIPDALEAGSR
jgi:hypothetical protein